MDPLLLMNKVGHNQNFQCQFIRMEQRNYNNVHNEIKHCLYSKKLILVDENVVLSKKYY